MMSESVSPARSVGRKSKDSGRGGRRRMNLHAALSFFIYLSSSLGALARPPAHSVFSLSNQLLLLLSLFHNCSPSSSSPPVSFRDVTRSCIV